MMQLTKTSSRGSDIFYKLWILAKPSTFTLPYAWPFIDIFVVRPANNSEEYLIDHHPFPKSYFLPLQNWRFGGLTLPVPANRDILTLMYSPDYMKRCASANFIHRLEQHHPQIERPAEAVREAGCFVDLHAMAQAVWTSAPQRVGGWSITHGQGSVHLVRNRVSLHISDSIAALWNMMNGQSIGELAGRLNGPRIEIMYKLFEIIYTLEKHQVITLDASH